MEARGRDGVEEQSVSSDGGVGWWWPGFFEAEGGAGGGFGALLIDLADPLGELGIEIPGGDYSRIAPRLFLGHAVHGANITVGLRG